jgi:hypothetical protein
MPQIITRTSREVVNFLGTMAEAEALRENL